MCGVLYCLYNVDRYGSAAGFSNGTPVNVDNIEVDQLLFGTAVYTTALIAVTMRICMDTTYWNRINVVGVLVFSLLLYFAFLLLYTGIDDIFGSATTPGIYWVGFKLWYASACVAAIQQGGEGGGVEIQEEVAKRISALIRQLTLIVFHLSV